MEKNVMTMNIAIRDVTLWQTLNRMAREAVQYITAVFDSARLTYELRKNNIGIRRMLYDKTSPVVECIEEEYEQFTFEPFANVRRIFANTNIASSVNLAEQPQVTIASTFDFDGFDIMLPDTENGTSGGTEKTEIGGILGAVQKAGYQANEFYTNWSGYFVVVGDGGYTWLELEVQ